LAVISIVSPEFVAADLSAGVQTEAEALAKAEEGMAEMSKVYDETGRELYMGAGYGRW
jgi:hypothetical protein